MKYYQPKGIADVNAGYIDGNPQQAIKGSVIPAGAIEMPQREIVNIITKGGVVPAVDDLYQMTYGVRRALYAWGVDTGSQNSLSVALDPPLKAYASGLEIRVLVGNDNNAAATIRVNGLPTQQIVKKDGSTLMVGDLKAGGIAILCHDGSNFQLVSGAGSSTTITGSNWFNGADFIIDQGTVNHIVGTPPIAPTAYAAGQSYLVLVKNRNTDKIDINVNNLGVRSCVLPTVGELEAGDIIPLMLIRISFDGSKFHMLSQIDMAVMPITMTKVVGPQAGADFADLNEAMNWANRRVFDKDGLLILNMQSQNTGTPLVHNYAVPIIIDHPQGDHIVIRGAGMNGIANIPVQTTGYSIGAILADANANLAALRQQFQCEIHFTTAGTGFYIRNNLGMMQNLLVTGLGPQGGSVTGIAVTENSYLFIDTVAVSHCSGGTWYLSMNSTISGQNFYSNGCSPFVGLNYGSQLTIGECAASGSKRLTVPLNTGNGHFCICASLVDGIQMTFSSSVHVALYANVPGIYSCYNYGINHWGNSNVHMGNLHIGYCGVGGICTVGAVAAIGSSTPGGTNISSCGGNAITVSQGGELDASYSLTAGNGGYDYQAAHGSYIYAGGFQNSGAQFSPARNTWGNGNSMVEG